jgi:hypothetical protein
MSDIDDPAYDPYPGGECFCGGCIGMGPCDDELGVTDEDDLDDDDCPDCVAGTCLGGCDSADYDDSPPWPPGVVTVDTGGLT